VVEKTLKGGSAPRRAVGATGGALPPSDHAVRMTAMRLVHAAAELVCEEGMAAATGPRIAALAGASPRQFHDVFPTIESCLWAGCAQGLSRAAARARRQAGGSTASRGQAALDGLLEFVEQEVELAGLGVAVAADAGATLLPRGSLPKRERLSLAALMPALVLVQRALTVLAQEPRLHEQRLAARAGLSSHAQSARLLRCLLVLRLLERADATQPALLTPRGLRITELLASAAGR
jgi:AcrR family transcriptional regulator